MATEAVIHFPSMQSMPDAVFYEDADGDLQCYEIETTPALAGAWMTLLARENTTWPQFFKRLGDRNPNPAVWEPVAIEDGVSVEEFVRAMMSS